MLKRAFDLLFGFLALIFAFPIMALCVLMVYFEDGFPVIFRQERVGKDGQLFEMFKIRTMVKNAEQRQDRVEKFDLNGNLIYKVKGDPRVTRCRGVSCVVSAWMNFLNFSTFSRGP